MDSHRFLSMKKSGREESAREVGLHLGCRRGRQLSDLPYKHSPTGWWYPCGARVEEPGAGLASHFWRPSGALSGGLFLSHSRRHGCRRDFLGPGRCGAQCVDVAVGKPRGLM